MRKPRSERLAGFPKVTSLALAEAELLALSVGSIVVSELCSLFDKHHSEMLK